MARVAAVVAGTVIDSTTFGNALITDYMSQTDATDQNLASDLEITALKELRANKISDTSGGVIDITDAAVSLKDGSTIGGDAICKIKTGTYTGDGNATQAITGVGFSPKHLEILRHTNGANNGQWIKTDQMGLNSVIVYLDGGASGHRYGADIIISMDADGFTVGTSWEINVNAVVYSYTAMG